MINNYYLSINKLNISISENFKYPNTFFRIFKTNFYSNDNFYLIEGFEKKLYLCLTENNEIILKEDTNCSYIWKFIEINKNNYTIENINKCILKIDKYNIICDYNSNKYETLFQINKIYYEVQKKNNNSYYN